MISDLLCIYHDDPKVTPAETLRTDRIAWFNFTGKYLPLIVNVAFKDIQAATLCYLSFIN